MKKENSNSKENEAKKTKLKKPVAHKKSWFTENRNIIILLIGFLIIILLIVCSSFYMVTSITESLTELEQRAEMLEQKLNNIENNQLKIATQINKIDNKLYIDSTQTPDQENELKLSKLNKKVLNKDTEKESKSYSKIIWYFLILVLLVIIIVITSIAIKRFRKDFYQTFI